MKACMKIFAWMLLLAASGTAMAADKAVAIPAEWSADWVTTITNLDPMVKAAFSHLFGESLLTTSGTGTASALGSALSVFNMVAMVLGVIIISYTIVVGAMKTAVDGELLGKSWSSVFLPLRTALGFGMITPYNGESAFSVVQHIFMWIIIAGSNSASWVWEHTYKQVATYETALLGAPPAPSLEQFVNIAGSAVCANNDSFRTNGNRTTFRRALYTVVSQDSAGKKTVASYTGVPTDSPYKLASGQIISRITFGPSGLCGEMSIFAGDPTKNTETVNKAFAASSQLLIQWLNYFSTLETLARKEGLNSKLLDLILEGANTSSEDVAKYRPVIDKIQAAVVADAGSYQSGMLDGVMNIFKESMKTEEAKESLRSYKSWMMAGPAMMRLANHSAAPNNVLQTISQGLQNQAWRVCAEGTEDCQAISTSGAQKARGNQPRAESTMGVMKILYAALESGNIKSISGGTLGSTELTCSEKGCSATSLINKPVSEINRVIFDTIILPISQNPSESNGAMPSAVDFTGSSNPMYVASQVGHSIITIATYAWTAGLVATVGAHAVGDSALGLVGGGGISAGIDYVAHTFEPMLLMILASGALLAYVVPFWLIIRWVWAVMNYLLICIEAILAAPLAVIMLCSPEGDGISGNNGNKVMLMIFQIFLWPTILIIALVAVMNISSLFFSFLNAVWFTDVAGYNTTGMFDVIVRLVIWVTFLHTLNVTAVSFIDTLPKALFDWIGGGLAKQLDNGGEQAVERAVSKAEGLSESGMRGALSPMKEGRAKAIRKREAEELKQS